MIYQDIKSLVVIFNIFSSYAFVIFIITISVQKLGIMASQ